VPRETLSIAEKTDNEVKQAQFMNSATLPLPLPKLADPRTTSNPEVQQPWPMTLQQAIRIGLDNSEVVRVISLGAQGIPVGGFEPQFLNPGAGGPLGSGTLLTVYDPAIQETQIAQALSTFDAQLQTSLLYGNNVTPNNNSISAGTFSIGSRYPIIFDQRTAQFATSIQKRLATGATAQITHNINYAYSNSPANTFPSAYTTNTQLQFTQPLLGGSQQSGPSGLEANRAPILIARINADVAVWRFKAEIMAHARSVEQQYWVLAQQQVRLWASETAVDLGEQILKRERAKLEVGTGSLPNVAEAQENLERFRLDLVSATADVVTTERQLRNILGLPPADNRRIVPVSAPTEARLEPNWPVCLSQMISFHPDIVQQQLLVRLTELQVLQARNQLLPVLNFNTLYQFNGLGQHLDQSEAVMTGATLRAINPILQQQQRAAGLSPLPGAYSNFVTWQTGLQFSMPLGFRNALANTKQAQYSLLRQRAFLQQTVHQTTHQLARFFLEVDANYKQFKTATRLKAAALSRLEAQRAFYETGQITIDRYLDAVNRWANAVAQEADFKSRYNTSIAALEEAKGTLLAYDNIAVAEGPNPHKAYIQAVDQQNAHRQVPVGDNGSPYPRIINGPEMLSPVEPKAPSNANPANNLPAFPAPAGPAGPAPNSTAPQLPAGIPNEAAGMPVRGTNDGSALPASLTAPAMAPRPLDGPVPAAAPADELPPLPVLPAE
jgi:outer membrane protein TolC